MISAFGIEHGEISKNTPQLATATPLRPAKPKLPTPPGAVKPTVGPTANRPGAPGKPRPAGGVRVGQGALTPVQPPRRPF